MSASGAGRIGGARLRARQHQPVAGLPRARAAAHREGGLPDAVEQLRRRGIQRVAARAAAGRPTPRAPRRVAREDAPRSSLSSPKAAKDSGVPPVPTPTSSRPPDSRSSTTASSATRTAFSSGSVTMPVPRRMRRARGHVGEEHERRRQAALVFVKVVLRHPGRIEAEGLGMGDLFGDEAVALGGRCVVEQAAEEAEAIEAPSAGNGVRDLMPGIRKEISCEEAFECCPQHRIAGNADLEFAYLFFMREGRQCFSAACSRRRRRSSRPVRFPVADACLPLLARVLGAAVRSFRAAPAPTPTACPTPRMSPASLLLYFAAQGTPST
jgi:hypothetical protein